LSDSEDMKPEDETSKESKPFVDEETSFSFLFFITAGALLFVTLWSFWDDEFTRRGFKQYQGEYFKTLIKIVLRIGFNIKYILVTPWINI